jgi:hypothetical protein
MQYHAATARYLSLIEPKSSNPRVSKSCLSGGVPTGFSFVADWVEAGLRRMQAQSRKGKLSKREFDFGLQMHFGLQDPGKQATFSGQSAPKVENRFLKSNHDCGSFEVFRSLSHHTAFMLFLVNFVDQQEPLTTLHGGR